MKDPQRLLIGDGTPLERELLRSVLDEPVPTALHARMLAALPLHPAPLEVGFDPSATAGSGGSAVGKASAVGKVGLAKLGSLKTLLVSLGVGSALTVAWVRSQSTDLVSHTLDTSGSAATNERLLDSKVDRIDSKLEKGGSKPDRVDSNLGEAHSTPNKLDSKGAEPVALETESERLVRPPDVSPADVPTSSLHGVAAAPNAQSQTRVRRAAKPSATSPSMPALASTTEYAPKLVSPTLGAELKLLDAARAAIQRGDSERSLQLLDAYKRQFPHGELAHEASVLRGLAQRKNQ